MKSKKNKFSIVKLFLSVLGLIVVLHLLASCNGQLFSVAAKPTPTITPEPIVPTRTVAAPAEDKPIDEQETILAVTPTNTPASNVDAKPSATPVGTAEEADLLQPITQETPIYQPSTIERFGGTGSIGTVIEAHENGLQIGSMLNWNVNQTFEYDEINLWQMIRLEEAGIRETTWEIVEATLEENPGSYWLVGNEPDVPWQDNVTPQRYAEIYHAVYHFIKNRDPEAKIVIGGVSQPTPLRRAYLDIILNTYQESYGEKMPIDVWNVHAFTLREERDSWGVGIPPGMDVDTGELYEIEDHDDLQILRQNLIDFRAWMTERGYQNKPLVVSEYGILMPEDYGFPIEVLGDFLTGSFDLFLELANETGYQPDDNRLVQWWFWYSVFDPNVYPTGNLIDVDTGEFTPLGEIWNTYVSELRTES